MINRIPPSAVTGGSAEWGGISGTLADQSDLQTALNDKQPLSTVLTNTTASFTTEQESRLAGLSSTAVTEVEHDFGTKPVFCGSFTITDAAITSSAKSVIISPSGKAATGRTSDDWQWDGATVVANPASGSAVVNVSFHPGPIVGPRKFQYMVI